MDYQPEKPSTKQMGVSLFPVYFITLMLGTLAILIIGKSAWWWKNVEQSTCDLQRYMNIIDNI